MRTEHTCIFIIWSSIGIKGEVSREKFLASKASVTPNSFPSDRSNVVPLLQFFVCASVISYVVFVVFLFV